MLKYVFHILFQETILPHRILFYLFECQVVEGVQGDPDHARQGQSQPYGFRPGGVGVGAVGDGGVGHLA